MLREKGHVISRDGRYATIYLPYHLMGVETPASIREAASGRVLQPSARRSILGARAAVNIPAGTVFLVEGHHHDIVGLNTAMVEDAIAAPFYLLDGATASRDIKAGELLTVDDVEGFDPTLLAAHQAGL